MPTASPLSPTTRVSPRVVRLFSSWAVPLVVFGAYLFLIETIGASLTVTLITFVVFLCVVVLWFMFRELAAHAAIARAIAIGEPDEVLTRARAAIQHRLTARGKLAFRVEEAVGLGLRGEWAASIAALDALAGAALKPAWRVVAATARVHAATELGDAAAARAAAADVTAGTRPIDIVRRECEARVAFVEGDHARAGALFRALGSEIRLGPAPRAAALYYAGRCAQATGGDDARSLFERAIALAPRTWIKAAASAQLRPA